MFQRFSISCILWISINVTHLSHKEIDTGPLTRWPPGNDVCMSSCQMLYKVLILEQPNPLSDFLGQLISELETTVEMFNRCEPQKALTLFPCLISFIWLVLHLKY